jgi:hypothetical protein
MSIHEDFKIWWHNEGSGMPPRKSEDTCEHVERITEIAWHNGAYKANEKLLDENARLKAEVERLRKAGDWLPIESAPRDGSYFIGGVWGDMESRPTWATMCHYYVRGKRFEMQETCDQPDFWIPLPNAPKEGKPSV